MANLKLSLRIGVWMVATGLMILKNLRVQVGSHYFTVELVGQQMTQQDATEDASTATAISNSQEATNNNNNNGMINFLHIPKAGGSTIELISLQNSHKCGLWGARMTGNATLGKEYAWGSGHWHHSGSYQNKTCRCAEWHMPPSTFRDDTLLQMLYPAPETFCVMREPLSKLVSYYYYHKKGPTTFKKGKGNGNGNATHNKKLQRGPCYDDSAEEMNRELELDLLKALDVNGCTGGCHLMPQTAFLQNINDLTGNPPSRQQQQLKNCKHVLLLNDQLEFNFNALMERVNCSIRYPDFAHSNKAGTNCPDKPELYLPGKEHLIGKPYTARTPQDFSPRVRELAERLYKDDIELYARLLQQQKSPKRQVVRKEPVIVVPVTATVSCGNHRASNCSECAQGRGAGWCHGECQWNNNSTLPDPHCILRVE